MSGPAAWISPLPAFLADPALGDVLAALPRARLVGGCVRDAWLGREVHDIDLATPDAPEAVVAALRGAGLKSAPTGIAHGTVTAIARHRGFEVTTLRRDVATDGRHAVVAFTEDWRADAARRDFTINALSMTADGAVYDHFDGLADLEAGRVRFVGDPATRIAEDYLRVLRFFRFQARYGRAAPDAAALMAITAAVPGLARLSAERVWSELKRILCGPDPAGSVALMRAAGVLAAVVPEAGEGAGLARMAAAGAPADAVLRLAALIDGDGAALAARLKLSGVEAGRLLALRAAVAPDAGALPDDADDDALRRALADTPAEVLVGAAWLAGRGEGLRARLLAIRRPVFPLAGRDLAAVGVPAGPGMGALLRDLRGWWLQGGCRADAVACRVELARRLAG